MIYKKKDNASVKRSNVEKSAPKPSTYTWLKQTSVKVRDMCGA